MDLYIHSNNLTFLQYMMWSWTTIKNLETLKSNLEPRLRSRGCTQLKSPMRPISVFIWNLFRSSDRIKTSVKMVSNEWMYSWTSLKLYNSDDHEITWDQIPELNPQVLLRRYGQRSSTKSFMKNLLINDIKR